MGGEGDWMGKQMGKGAGEGRMKGESMGKDQLKSGVVGQEYLWGELENFRQWKFPGIYEGTHAEPPSNESYEA